MLNDEHGRLLLTIDRDELLTHLAARADYHAKRSAEASADADREEKRLEQMLSAADTVTDRMSVKAGADYSSANLSRENAREKVRRHAQVSARFGFMASHLGPGSSVVLSLAECAQLELTT